MVGSQIFSSFFFSLSLYIYILFMTDKPENKTSLSEAEEFLESLNLPDAQPQDTDGDATSGSTDPNDIMSFLDEISNYPTDDSKTSQPESANKPVEADKPKQQQQPVTEQATSEEEANDNGWKSWGNSFWSQASAAVKTTTDQINRSVTSDSASKLLESRVKTLQSLVNKENIEKLGKI